MTLFLFTILQATIIIVLGVIIFKLKKNVTKIKQERHVANIRMLQAEQDLRGLIKSGKKF
jgi:hypothetical protein